MALWMLRALSAGGFGVFGWRLGLYISELSLDKEEFLPWGLALTLAGVIIGGTLAPYLILKPWRISAEFIDSLPSSALISATAGLLVGLAVASLISIPLYSLSGWPGWAVPVIVTGALGLSGLWMGIRREGDIRAIFPGLEAPTPSLSSNGVGWTGNAVKSA